MTRALIALYFLALARETYATSPDNCWNASTVIGLHLQLTDPNRIEEYWFTRNYVTPNVSSHDIVVDPRWHWRIRNCQLQIFSESQLENEFVLIGKNSKTITVRRKSGTVAQFRYSYRR